MNAQQQHASAVPVARVSTVVQIVPGSVYVRAYPGELPALVLADGDAGAEIMPRTDRVTADDVLAARELLDAAQRYHEVLVGLVRP